MICDTLIQTLYEPEPSVVITGDLDFRAAPEFREAAASLIDRHHGVVIDLERVTFIDSSGMAALLDSHSRASTEGKSVELKGACDYVRKALQVSGIASVLGLQPLTLRSFDDEMCGSSDLRRAEWQVDECVVVGRPVLVASLRENAAGLAREAGLSESEVSDVKLAVGEALTNALKHGLLPGRDKIRMRCMSCSTAFVVEISDQGPGFDPDAITPPIMGELRSGGLGIHLMRASMDEVDFIFDGEGSKVRMLKWVRIHCSQD